MLSSAVARQDTQARRPQVLRTRIARLFRAITHHQLITVTTSMGLEPLHLMSTKTRLSSCATLATHMTDLSSLPLSAARVEPMGISIMISAV
jgi:hypothetical protein